MVRFIVRLRWDLFGCKIQLSNGFFEPFPPVGQPCQRDFSGI